MRSRSRAAAPRRQRHRPPAQGRRSRRVEPLSTTITSPSRPFSSSTARAVETHSAIVSASSRHGMTTDTRTVGGAAVAVIAIEAERIGRVRVCIVYDCLYPYTIGGAERWYRNLAERLAGSGHEVTYLTLRQWDRGYAPDVPGRPRHRCRPADDALRSQRAAATAAADRLRDGGAPPPAPTRPALRRSCTRRRSRTSRFSPLPSRARRLRVSSRRRLARGLDSRVLA